MTSTNLLGPPEIYSTTSRRRHKQESYSIEVDNPFTPLMSPNINDPNYSFLPHPSPMCYTENSSRTFLSTANPCLDFFFHIVPDTPSESLIRLLQLSWDHDPLTTLKLICNLRGVRGKGKSDKEGYYTSVLWLHKLHPKTLACNLASMAYFGYFKDLPEILYRILEGDHVRKKFKECRRGYKGAPIRNIWMDTSRMKQRRSYRPSFPHPPTGSAENSSEKERRSKLPRQVRVKANLKKHEEERKRARKEREEKKVTRAKKAVERYRHDPDYKFLYDRVSDFFAERLKADIGFLNSGQLKGISLAAKWCPSLDSSFDKYTLLCETIARKVFPKDFDPEYQGIEDAHYAYRVRDRLRKEVLVPLRKALELPEVYIGANNWGSIPYNRVASVAMKTYKKLFLKHDRQRFEEYLGKVKAGKAKIASGALLPHEIIKSKHDQQRFEEYLEKDKAGKANIAAGALLPHEIIKSLHDAEGGHEVAELQWKRMVEDLSQNRKLKDCLAICDVSGSMAGIPMEVSVALGVLVSELSDAPWKGKLITFSAQPKLQTIEGKDLASKIQFVRNMECGMNTDFQKVFDVILNVAVNGKLRKNQMIKRLFVFSGMKFDQASSHPWETDYLAIVRKFKKAGFGNYVPEIVFWNLRDSKATPVPGKQRGVALVSGFSKNLMTVFLEENGKLTPEAVMEAAISGEEYKGLVVLD